MQLQVANWPANAHQGARAQIAPLDSINYSNTEILRSRSAININQVNAITKALLKSHLKQSLTKSYACK